MFLKIQSITFQLEFQKYPNIIGFSLYLSNNYHIKAKGKRKKEKMQKEKAGRTPKGCNMNRIKDTP